MFSKSSYILSSHNQSIKLYIRYQYKHFLFLSTIISSCSICSLIAFKIAIHSSNVNPIFNYQSIIANFGFSLFYSFLFHACIKLNSFLFESVSSQLLLRLKSQFIIYVTQRSQHISYMVISLDHCQRPNMNKLPIMSNGQSLLLVL